MVMTYDGKSKGKSEKGRWMVKERENKLGSAGPLEVTTQPP